MSEVSGPGQAAARTAEPSDLPDLLRLYEELAAEMAGLRPMWAFSDAIAAPLEATITSMLAADEWSVILGTVDDIGVGFLAWRDEALLPQARGSRLASIRYVYTEPPARGVGVGEAMMDRFFEGAAARGITRFDAHVSPGHREAKNFFESNGFKARSIVMHRSDA